MLVCQRVNISLRFVHYIHWNIIGVLIELPLFGSYPIIKHHQIVVGGIPTPLKNISQWEG